MKPVFLRLFGAALMLSAVTGASAQSANSRPDRTEQDDSRRPQQNNQQRPSQNSNQRPQSGPNYGTWQNSWGARPPAPPSHWTRTSDWYRHVRACQQRFRSYTARTDTYRTNSGRTRRCTL